MQHPDANEAMMSVRGALQALAESRGAATVVVTNQGSSRVWPLIADHPLDFHYNPSTMGGAIPFGLGLALSRPSMHVVVITGDGALTMNLGSLISVVAARAENLTVIVLDNGIYEVTGGQRTAASQAEVDYVALAKSLGFQTTVRFQDEADWYEQASSVLALPGPRLVSLRVATALPADMNTTLPPISERLSRFSKALPG